MDEEKPVCEVELAKSPELYTLHKLWIFSYMDGFQEGLLDRECCRSLRSRTSGLDGSKCGWALREVESCSKFKINNKYV